MVKYKDMDKAIKELGGNILDAYTHDMYKFIITQTINKKGAYKVTLEFDAEQLLKNPNKGIPRDDHDWKLRPLILFLKLKEPKKRKHNSPKKPNKN